MKSINPYLMFNGNAEEAFTFYRSVFGGELQLIRFADMKEASGLPDEAKNMVAHAALPLNGVDQILMGSDCPPGQAVDISERANFSICLELGDPDETQRLFDALAAGGTVSMTPAETEWTALFGMLTDRFSISWMFDYSNR